MSDKIGLDLKIWENVVRTLMRFNSAFRDRYRISRDKGAVSPKGRGEGGRHDRLEKTIPVPTPSPWLMYAKIARSGPKSRISFRKRWTRRMNGGENKMLTLDPFIINAPVCLLSRRTRCAQGTCKLFSGGSREMDSVGRRSLTTCNESDFSGPDGRCGSLIRIVNADFSDRRL